MDADTHTDIDEPPGSEAASSNPITRLIRNAEAVRESRMRAGMGESRLLAALDKARCGEADMPLEIMCVPSVRFRNKIAWMASDSRWVAMSREQSVETIADAFGVKRDDVRTCESASRCLASHIRVRTRDLPVVTAVECGDCLVMCVDDGSVRILATFELRVDELASVLIVASLRVSVRSAMDRPFARVSWHWWSTFVCELFRCEDQREAVCNLLGSSLPTYAWPTTALYLVGPRGSGKSTFADAIRELIKYPLVQTTSQAAIELVDRDNFMVSATWPLASMLFVDEFTLPTDRPLASSPTLAKLCTSEPIPTRRMYAMPSTEDCAAQLVITSLDRLDYRMIPIAMARRLSIVTVAPSGRATPINKYGHVLASECSDAIICWLAHGAARCRAHPSMCGRPMSSLFAFGPMPIESTFDSVAK